MTSAARQLVTVDRICDGLAARIDALVRELLPRGRRDGHEWRVGSLAGEPGRSLAVHLGGGKAGVWSDFSTGQCGDALDLVMAIADLARYRRDTDKSDKAAAFRWAQAWLGLGDGAPLPTTPPPPARRARETEEDGEKRAAAFRIWIGASPQLRGTPAETYLRSRGIELDRLGRQPRALRFAARLKHPCGEFWPALVAGIVSASGRGAQVAIHRTWLMPDGMGKAPVPAGADGRPGDAKMSLGTYKGGLIPLWRGASGKPLKDAVPGETLILAEGIEDGLSAAVAGPDYRVAAAVSLANMGAIRLPPAIATVIIAGQNDPWFDERAGREHATRRGLDRAIRNFQAQGKNVRIARPPCGKDLNDTLRGIA